MKRIISLVLCAVLLSCSFCFVSTAADVTATGATVVDLGIPTLSMYPVGSTYATARTVWDVESYDGKIYIGCGNYDSNAGSNVGLLPVYSYDPATQTWTKEYSVNDEQISRFFSEWGNLYIAGMDPGAGAGENGNFYYQVDGKWATNSSVYRGIHMFDMLFLEDGKTVFAGLGTNTGVQPYISKSTDGGKTWNLVSFKKDGSTISNTSTTWSRTHNMFEYNGEIYGTLWVSGGGNTGNMGLYKYNASTDTMDYYAATPSSLYLNSMSNGYDFTFNGKFVSVYNSITVFSDDLKSWNTISGYTGTPTCAQVIGDYMYFTTYSGNDNYLYRTKDLSYFEQLSQITINDSNYTYVQSFDYLDGTFYMGTRSSYAASESNGTVFALTLTEDNCTHANMVTETTEATCTVDGLKSESCPDCGYNNDTVLTAPGHSYTGEWIVETAATCTTDGLERRECSACTDGDSRVIEATGHDMPETWTQLIAPTCSAVGYERRVCADCSYAESQAIPMVDHEYSDEYTVDQAMTCTEDEIKSRHCLNCTATTDVVTTATTGHNFVGASCTACGEAAPVIMGDANGDDAVNVIDLTIGAQYIAQRGISGTFDLSAYDIDLLDLTGDGKLDQLDLNAIAAIIRAAEILRGNFSRNVSPRPFKSSRKGAFSLGYITVSCLSGDFLLLYH